MAQLRQRKAEIEAAGGHVVLVGMGKPREAETFREQFQVPFPMICDPHRDLYGAYRLERTGMFSLLSPALALKGLSAMSQGHLMGLPEGDVKQLAGVFVIDTAGHIRFSHRSSDPADITDVAVVLQALHGIDRQ